MPKKPQISYTNKDFSSIKEALINYVKVYYPNTYKDFNEASFGSLLFDLVAYVGDINSFHTDYSFNESFVETAIEENNLLKLAKQHGYKTKGSPSSTGTVAFYVTVPSTSAGGQPDSVYIPVLKAGTILSSDGGAAFFLSNDVDFNKSNTLVKVAAVDATGGVTSYAMKAYGEVVSGEIKREDFTIGALQKFLTLTIAEDKVSEIISIIDSEGREYFEVDNLSQDTVFKPIRNFGSDVDTVPFLLKEMQVPRRFTTDFDLDGNVTIQFGHGSESELYDKTFPDPTEAVLKLHGKNYFSDKSFDPTKISITEKFGIAPENTTLTVTYRRNTDENMNAAVGTLTTVIDPILEFKESTVSKQDAISQISDVEADNESAIVGSSILPTIQELREQIKGSYASQNRAVTKEDYISVCHKMPAQFGAIKRVNITQDVDSFKRNLNLYVLAEDSNEKLTTASVTLKRNLKNWVSKYKMINDTIDILNGVIINIGINFEIITEIGKDKTLILGECLQVLRDRYKIKTRFGESFYIGEIYQLLNDIDGVEDTVNVMITRKIGTNYSSSQFSIEENKIMSGRFIKVPQNIVLEIKELDDDITGVVK